MRKSRIIFILYLVMLSCRCVVGQAEADYNIDDIIPLVEAHFSQIRDIEFTYDHRITPVAEPEYTEKNHTDLIWMPYNNLEKRITKSLTSEEKGIENELIAAWDGGYSKSLITIKDMTKGEESKQGRVSSEKVRFPGLDPLLILEMRGTTTNEKLSDFLRIKDTLVEGSEIIGGHETFIVSVNRIPSFPRKDSLIIKYWLDMNRGGLPLRVEVYHKEKLRRVTSEVQLSEVKPGIYFPTKMNVKTFGGKDPGRWFEGELNEFQVDVNSIKINQGLTKENFGLQYAHGTYVFNDDTGIGYYEGIGLQDQQTVDEMFLSEVAEDANKTFKHDRNQSENSSELSTSSSTPVAERDTMSGNNSNPSGKVKPSRKIVFITVPIICLVAFLSAVYMITRCVYKKRRTQQKYRSC